MKKIKTPWPTKDAMTQVYQDQLWGAGESTYYSGEGSHLKYIVTPYVKAVTEFISSLNAPITVCDLGCGDFNVGKQIAPFTKKYIGVDIVAPLITYNKTKYTAKNITFECLDISKEKLPQGDCALVRQVLQHLSNAEIQQILNKLKHYQYVVITEHIPQGDFIPNIDIIAGQGTRLKKESGVVVTTNPFDFEYTSSQALLTIPLKNEMGIISTTLYTTF